MRFERRHSCPSCLRPTRRHCSTIYFVGRYFYHTRIYLERYISADRTSWRSRVCLRLFNSTDAFVRPADRTNENLISPVLITFQSRTHARQIANGILALGRGKAGRACGRTGGRVGRQAGMGTMHNGHIRQLLIYGILTDLDRPPTPFLPPSLQSSLKRLRKTALAQVYIHTRAHIVTYERPHTKPVEAMMR